MRMDSSFSTSPTAVYAATTTAPLGSRMYAATTAAPLGSRMYAVPTAAPLGSRITTASSVSELPVCVCGGRGEGGRDYETL